jgi:hypothetical protein
MFTTVFFLFQSEIKTKSLAGTVNTSRAPCGLEGGRVARSVVSCVAFCRSLFIMLFFFFWPLYYLSFFDLWLLIIPVVSSDFDTHSMQLVNL